MIMKDQDISSASSAFQEYHQARSAISALEEEQARLEDENNQAQQILVLLLLTLPANSHQSQNHPQVQAVASLMNDNSRRLADIVSKFPEI